MFRRPPDAHYGWRLIILDDVAVTGVAYDEQHDAEVDVLADRVGASRLQLSRQGPDRAVDPVIADVAPDGRYCHRRHDPDDPGDDEQLD
jgi:hypothetical protein